MKRRSWKIALAILALTWNMQTAKADEHEHGHGADPIIGRSAAGKLMVEADLDHSFLLMPIEGSAIPGYAGWAMDDPGFFSLEEDEPDEDFFRLAPGADIRLACVSIDNGLKVRNPEQLFFPTVISQAGDSFRLGNHELHIHPIWHIDSLAPGFDPQQTSWQATFKLIDVGSTLYAESDPFVMSFTNVPEPTTITLLLAGAAAGLWTRTSGRTSARNRNR